MQNRIRPLHIQAKHSTTQSAPTSSQANAGQADEALRRVIASQVGPRKPGVLYRNIDGVFEVVDITTDRAEARRLLNRQSAQFAITVLNLLTGEVSTIGSTWTSSDQLLESVSL